MKHVGSMFLMVCGAATIALTAHLSTIEEQKTRALPVLGSMLGICLGVLGYQYYLEDVRAEKLGRSSGVRDL